MSAFEIVATVILCILGTCMILLWGMTMLLFDKIVNLREIEKKPASKNETDIKK